MATNQSAAIDQLYAAQRQSGLNSLAQKRDQALSSINSQQQDLSNQFNQSLPQFQDQRNAASYQGWKTQQGLLANAAANGNYRAGSTQTAMINTANNTANNIGNVTKQQDIANQNYQTKLNQLADQRNQANQSYASDANSLNQQIAAELNKAKSDLLAQQQAAAASAVRRSSGGSSGKVSKTDAISSAYQGIQQMFDSGYGIDEVRNQLLKQQPTLAGYGLSQTDINNLDNYANALYSKIYGQQYLNNQKLKTLFNGPQ